MRQESMRRTPWILVLALIAALAVGAAGCGGDEQEVDEAAPAEEAPAEEPPTEVGSDNTDELVVGISSFPWISPPLRDAGLQAMAEAENLGGVEVVFALTEEGAGQVDSVEGLISKGVDVLAINPNDDKAIIPAVKKANDAGIPVIMWVGGVTEGEVATTIVTSETLGGELIGEWVFEKLQGNGKVALLQGYVSHPAYRARELGFRAALEKYPEVELVSVAEGQGVREKGQQVAADFLTRTPDLDSIVALNDEMALGALTSLEDRNLLGEVIVTGYNGQCTALASVWQGELTAVLYQPFGDMGREIVKLAVKLDQGEEIPEEVVLREFVIDKAKMEDILEGKEEVAPGVLASVQNAAKGCS